MISAARPSPRCRVAILGASGYTGAELLRLCAQHSEFEVVYATGDSQSGTLAASLYPSLAAAYPNLVFEEYSADRAAGLDVVFLGLPHEASLAMAPTLLGKVGCVVDLSAAYRLKDASLYPRWYGFTHDQPELLASAVYGLPETHRAELRGARGPGRVVEPGGGLEGDRQEGVPLEPGRQAGRVERRRGRRPRDPDRATTAPPRRRWPRRRRSLSSSGSARCAP